MMSEFLLACWRQSRDIVKARKMAARLFKAALQFNCLHTYGSRAEWMCPRCNRVHKSDGWTVFAGLTYPACCGLPSGHRYGADFATDGSRTAPHKAAE